MKTTQELLNALKEHIRSGALTKATCIDCEAIICMVEKKEKEIVYHQVAYDSLEESAQERLRYLKAGDVVGSIKIVGVLDMWPEAAPVAEPLPVKNLPIAS